MNRKKTIRAADDERRIFKKWTQRTKPTLSNDAAKAKNAETFVSSFFVLTMVALQAGGHLDERIDGRLYSGFLHLPA